MRLDKFVADAASLTRSQARREIKNGNVKIEDETVRDIACQVAENENVFLKETPLCHTKYIYLMLNKPAGVITATEDKKQKTVMDIIDKSYERYRLSPVGRLDIDTEGFLLLTNDGEMAHNLLSPNKKVGKTYLVRLAKNITDEQRAILEEGVDIGECITKKAQTKRISDNEIHLTITEGKFHQIKRMAKAVGNEVVYLRRISYGNLYLDESLLTGEYRRLNESEVAILRQNMKKE